MSTIEQQLKEAFAHVNTPESAKTNTLAAIESLRKEEAQAAKRRKSLRIRRFSQAAVSVAACFALALVGISALQTKSNTPETTTQAASENTSVATSQPASSPAAYVSFDINPSIEFEVNEEGTVIAAQALNSDAQAVLNAISVDGLPYQTALSNLLNSPQMTQYTSPNALLEVNIASDNAALSNELETITNNELAHHRLQSTCQQTTMQHHQEAAQNGMGMARYQAATELIALDPSLTLQECAGMSMRELRKQIASHHAESKSSQETHGKHRS